MASLKLNHPQSFDDVRRILAGRDLRTIGYSTTLRRCGDKFVVKYHATDIVTYSADDTMTLRAAGWLTVTTKDRLNTLLPNNSERRVYITQRQGRWYVHAANGTFPYADGIVVDLRTADVVSNPGASTAEIDDTYNADMKQRVTAYVKSITDERVNMLMADAQINGIGGDCWVCKFATPATPNDSPNDSHGDCLLSHIDENYVHVSLFIRALKFSGYTDAQIPYNINYAPTVRRAVRKLMLAQLLRGDTALKTHARTPMATA